MKTFLIIDEATGRGVGSSRTQAPGYVPAPYEVACTPEQHSDPGAWMRQGDALVPAPPLPDPVPRAVTAAQAQIALHRAPSLKPSDSAGRTFLDDVEEAVAAAGREVQIWYTRAQSWERSNPYVNELGRALGLSDTAMDDMFRDAAQISA